MASEMTDFEPARERWQRATATRRELISRLEGARMALGLAESPPGDGEQRSALVEEKAKAYLDGRRADPDRLRREIRELQDQVADAADQHAAESEAWRLALEAEQQRLAEICRPKHAAAVRQIARAVEMLSAAVQTERDVRAGLADVGAAHALPDAGFEFGSVGRIS